MNTSVRNRNNISPEVVGLITRLVSIIPWPARCQDIGDVLVTILNSKFQIAENEFGWNCASVTLGIKEFISGIVCVNDLTEQHKPKSE
jgi:hypothetical protein